MSRLIRSILPSPPRTIVSIFPDIEIKQAVEIMIRDNIGALVVADESGEYLGILSERDIIRTVVHQSLDPSHAKVLDAMCSAISVMDISEPVEKAMEVITATRRHHILVKDTDKIVAVLSIGDILLNLLESKSKTIEHLERYINASY
tara:strand:- start:730 stop:1170 length:441 start_codon:yes stop_codon:yes gene_type:complete